MNLNLNHNYSGISIKYSVNYPLPYIAVEDVKRRFWAGNINGVMTPVNMSNVLCNKIIQGWSYV